MTKHLFYAICVLLRGGGKMASRGRQNPTFRLRPSDQIVPFVPNSFLTYQAIYKSSHRTINGSPGIVPNDCMIFPYYHIGPNCHIRPNYFIGLDCYVGLDQHIGSN